VIVVKNKFIFLCTPRTGSRAIVNALQTLPDAYESREHHVHPEDVKETAEKLSKGSSTLPMFTILREPYEQVLSWFGHVVLRHEPKKCTAEDFADFIRTKSIGWYFHDKLNPYLLDLEGVRCEIFLKRHLERTLAGMFGKVNGALGTALITPRLTKMGGAFSPPLNLLNETTTHLIRERFPEDIRLWSELTGHM